MPDTSIGVSSDTKERFDEAQPDSLNQDEFLSQLLAEASIKPKRYVEVEHVIDAMDATRMNEDDVKRAVRDALEEARI